MFDEYQKKPLGWCNRCGCMFFKSELEEHEGYCIDCFTWRLKRVNRFFDELWEFARPILPFLPAAIGFAFVLNSLLKG